MHGDRPYWWVHNWEMAHNASIDGSVALPEIAQFRSTCETGPGMPSGHSMAMSAAWFVVIQAIVEHLVQPSNLRYFSFSILFFNLLNEYQKNNFICIIFTARH
jgi:glucose-6-phosphatase